MNILYKELKNCESTVVRPSISVNDFNSHHSLDYSPPGSSAHGIFQVRWSGLPFPSPGDLPDPGIKPVTVNLLLWQAVSLPLAPPGKPTLILTEVISLSGVRRYYPGMP